MKEDKKGGSGQAQVRCKGKGNLKCLDKVDKPKKLSGAGKPYRASLVLTWRLGRVKNGSKRFYKNPLAFFAAVLCILMVYLAKKGA